MAGPSSTTLPWFRPDQELKPLKVYSFFGKREGGKTTMMREVIYYLRRHFTEVYVFSATEDCNEAWAAHCPSTFIYNGFDSKKIERIIERQRARFKIYKQSLKRPGPNGPLPFPHTLIVAEDLMAMDKKKYVNDPGIRALHMNGRHWGFTLCQTVQYLIDLPPALRGNLDTCFMMQENSDRNMKNAHDNWASMTCEVAEFRDIMREATKDYGCLVINTGNNTDDCLSWYRAPRDGHGDFRIGSRAFWAFHFKHGGGRHVLRSGERSRVATIGVRRRANTQGRTLRLMPPSESKIEIESDKTKKAKKAKIRKIRKIRR